MKKISFLSKLKKYFLLLFVFLSLIILTASEYTIPRGAYSVCTADLDLDGDEDIVVGHKYVTQTNWGGISLLMNNGGGEFILSDTISFVHGFSVVQAANLDNNDFPDIYGQFVSDSPEPESNRFLGILYNQGNKDIDSISFYTLNSRTQTDYFSAGDLDGDNDLDVIFASNMGGYWGVLYNDGNGNFSEPVYYNVDYYPGDIACGDLNNDGKDDVVVCGQILEVYISPDFLDQNIVLAEDGFWNDVEIIDSDLDGMNDIVISQINAPHLPHYLQIYRNCGLDTFALVNEYSVSQGIFYMKGVDLNNDIYSDLIYVKDFPGHNRIYVRMNDGLGGFLDETGFLTNDNIYNCASADLDGNGYNDIVTVHSLAAYLEGNLHVLFNDSTGNFVEDPVTGINENNAQPTEFTLYQNYPNPFNGTTNISFYLPGEQSVTIIIYDIGGREVVRLIEDERHPEGKNQVEWDSKNSLGKNVSSGVYLYSLRVHNTEITKKMLLAE